MIIEDQHLVPRVEIVFPAHLLHSEEIEVARGLGENMKIRVVGDVVDNQSKKLQGKDRHNGQREK